MNNNNERYISYLIKLIKNEKQFITQHSEEVLNLADKIIEEVEIIKSGSKEITSDIITHYSSVRIQEKLQKLFNTQQDINFRKQNIRNYKNEIYKVKGSFNKDLEQ